MLCATQGFLSPYTAVRFLILFHYADHFIYIAVRVYYDSFCLAWCYISKSVYVGFIFLFNDFVSYFCFLIREVAGVFCHNFIIRIYRFFRILFPFRIQDIGFGEFECCYLILLCSGVREPSFECISVFCRDITFEADALAVSFFVIGLMKLPPSDANCSVTFPTIPSSLSKVARYLLSH